VRFTAITLCERVFTIVYFVIDSVQKLLGTPSYMRLDYEHITPSFYHAACVVRLLASVS
jgi:hypothetical protein